MDFAYSGVLKQRLGLAALAALLRAADRFGMPRLLSVCRVRVVGTAEPRDNDLFAVYDAAAAIKDAETTAAVRAKDVFLRRC